MAYEAFFRQTTGNTPYPWQRRLGEHAWPELIDVPTGLGKTAAVMVAWLHKRLIDDPETGRRLVYCLPMRALVRQTDSVARRIVTAAECAFAEAGRAAPTVSTLLGGEDAGDWEACASREQILIGTQDMLLSRALNRGYGMSRYRWPIPFALLNQDCLWIMDETQLMGVGVATSSQLQALREKWGGFGRSRTVWMSATLTAGLIETVDHACEPGGHPGLKLDAVDQSDPDVVRLTGAKKALHQAEVELNVANRKDYPKKLAQRIIELHRGGLTLVVLNRVDRAQDTYSALCAAGVEADLLHSRFRPCDRAEVESRLDAEEDRIVVSTQAVEAGVDISARTLVTELAPWSSLVQRFGRLNRYGLEEDARALVIDILPGKKDDLALPYEALEFEEARCLLREIQEVGPASLSHFAREDRQQVFPVLRAKDLADLFDTTPDLLGFDLDVSQYIRDADDTDVRMYWRSFEGEAPLADEPRPGREEMCAVSLRSTRAFFDALKKRAEKLRKKQGGTAPAHALFRWDPLSGRFLAIRWRGDLRPGQTLLCHADAGGYSTALGFTGDPDDPTPVVPPVVDDGLPDMEGDPDSGLGRWIALPLHLTHVRDEAAEIVRSHGKLGKLGEAVVTAAAWHDVGKAHEEFQRRLIEPVAELPELAPPEYGVWAKSAHRRSSRGGRPGFRHELASALAWLATCGGNPDRGAEWRDLVAYLIASHHGKVRVSLRSLPTERAPEEEDRPFARGVWHGDPLIEIVLPDGDVCGPLELDLRPVVMGAGSWLERILALRDAASLGPFRLALLESLVRLADWTASRKEERHEYD